MNKENLKLMYAYIFDSLKVFDDLDFICHYATDEEYSNFKNTDETWYPVFNRVLKEILDKKGYPFSLDEKDECLSDN